MLANNHSPTPNADDVMADGECGSAIGRCKLAALWHLCIFATRVTPIRHTDIRVCAVRDVECAGTVEHMFDQADVPERIFVGVCEQNHELPGGTEDCTTGKHWG